jgi:hypothetical protein
VIRTSPSWYIRAIPRKGWSGYGLGKRCSDLMCQVNPAGKWPRMRIVWWTLNMKSCKSFTGLVKERKRPMTIYCFLGALAGCLCLCQCARSNDLPHERFLNDYRAALKALEKAGSQVSIRGSVAEIVKRNEPEKMLRDMTSRILYSASDGFERFEFFEGGDSGLHRVLLKGNGLNFVSRQSPGDSSYYIEHDSLPERYDRFMSEFKSVSVDSPYRVGTNHLLEIVNSKHFKLHSVKQLGDRSEDLVQVDFENLPNNERMANSTGSMILDPQRGWALSSYHFHLVPFRHPDRTTDYSGSISYEPGSVSPKPQRVKVERIQPNSTQRYDSTPEYWDTSPVPAAEFSLQAFGLGDFLKPVPRQERSPFPFWILGTVLGVLALGLAIYQMSSKLRAGGKRTQAGSGSA